MNNRIGWMVCCLAAVALTAFSTAAETLDADGNFRKLYQGKLAFWHPQNTPGTLTLGPARKDGGRSVSFASAQSYRILQSRKMFKLGLGDELKVTVRASGKGTLLYGPVWYSSTPAWVANDYWNAALTGQPGDFTATFKIGTLVLKGASQFQFAVGVARNGEHATVDSVALEISKGEDGR